MYDIDDDVFESSAAGAGAALGVEVEDEERRHPSPTGYRDYKPPDEVLRMCQTDYIDDTEQVVHKTIILGDSGVGKTSLLVKFDTGKFSCGSFSATVGIGFTLLLICALVAPSMAHPFWGNNGNSGVGSWGPSGSSQGQPLIGNVGGRGIQSADIDPGYGSNSYYQPSPNYYDQCDYNPYGTEYPEYYPSAPRHDTWDIKPNYAPNYGRMPGYKR